MPIDIVTNAAAVNSMSGTKLPINANTANVPTRAPNNPIVLPILSSGIVESSVNAPARILRPAAISNTPPPWKNPKSVAPIRAAAAAIPIRATDKPINDCVICSEGIAAITCIAPAKILTAAARPISAIAPTCNFASVKLRAKVTAVSSRTSAVTTPNESISFSEGMFAIWFIADAKILTAADKPIKVIAPVFILASVTPRTNATAVNSNKSADTTPNESISFSEGIDATAFIAPARIITATAKPMNIPAAESKAAFDCHVFENFSIKYVKPNNSPISKVIIAIDLAAAPESSIANATIEATRMPIAFARLRRASDLIFVWVTLSVFVSCRNTLLIEAIIPIPLLNVPTMVLIK